MSPPRFHDVTWSMPAAMWCAPVVHGGYCRKTSRTGITSTKPFVVGVPRAGSKRCMTVCGRCGESGKNAMPCPARRCWMRKARVVRRRVGQSVTTPKGHKRRQEGQRSQAQPGCRYLGFTGGGRRLCGQPARPRRGHRCRSQRYGKIPHGATTVRRLRLRLTMGRR